MYVHLSTCYITQSIWRRAVLLPIRQGQGIRSGSRGVPVPDPGWCEISAQQRNDTSGSQGSLLSQTISS